MAESVIEWAGAERTFRLRLGEIMDLEEACGKVGIGTIFLRLTQHEYFARDLYHTVRLGLIGGGMSAGEAKALLDARFDVLPLATHLEVAMAILLELVSGMKSDDDTLPSSDDGKPIAKGDIFHALIQVGLSPEQVRTIGYEDFVALVRAAGPSRVPPITEAEFEDILARFEPEALTHVK